MMEWNVLDRLPTGELDEILRAELQKDVPNGDKVRYIMRTLEAREAECPDRVSSKVQVKWDAAMSRREQEWAAEQDAEIRRLEIRRWVFRIASMAAVLCLVLLCVLPKPAQAETWWEKLSRWTGEVFEFVNPTEATERHADYVFTSDNPGLKKVYDTIADLGVTDPIVPMWLPEGYELTECKVIPEPEKNGVRAYFVNDEKNELAFLIDVYNMDTWHEYQKDKENVVVYETNGVYFKVMRNNEEYLVIWEKGRAECSLSVICLEEELYKIIDSIYTPEVK